jgi:PAS domain S-box-containing protein
MNRPPVEPVLRAIVEGVSQGVLAVNTEGTILWANSVAEKLFAYSSEELPGLPVVRLIPDPPRARADGGGEWR